MLRCRFDDMPEAATTISDHEAMAFGESNHVACFADQLTFSIRAFKAHMGFMHWSAAKTGCKTSAMNWVLACALRSALLILPYRSSVYLYDQLD
jgi:hypothetical protein